MVEEGIGERFLFHYRHLNNKFLPLHSRRRSIYDWFLNQLKEIFGIKSTEALGEQILLRYRQKKNKLLPLGTGRRSLYDRNLNRLKALIGVTSAIDKPVPPPLGFSCDSIDYLRSFNKRERVYLRLCADGMGDVINLVPLIHSLLKEYSGCTVVTNHWQLPFQYISENCVSVPDGTGNFERNTNFFDFTDRVNFHLHCPSWMQYFIFLGYRPKPLLEDPFPLLPEREEMKLKMRDKPYVVFHTRSNRTEWQGRQTDPANVTKVIEQLHRQNINTVEVGSNIPLVHPDSISFINNTSLEDLVFLIKRCIGFVGIDSFPMHLASLYRKPILGFLGATQPLAFLPGVMPIVQVGNNSLPCLGCVNERRPNAYNTCPMGKALCEELYSHSTHIEQAIETFNRWISNREYFERFVTDCTVFYTDFLYRIGRRDFYTSRLLDHVAKDPNVLSLRISEDMCRGTSVNFFFQDCKFIRFIRNFSELAEYLYDHAHDKILIIYRGGVGDTLVLFWLTNALKRQFPDTYIFLFPADRNVKALNDMVRFMINVFVLDVVERDWDLFWEGITRKPLFDLIFDCRYVTRVTATSNKYEQFARSLSSAFDRRNINFDKFPLDNYLHRTHGVKILDLVKETSGIRMQPCDTTYPLSPEDFSHVEQLLDFPYVTISTGIDNSYMLNHPNLRMTKEWSLSYWRELIQKITSIGVKVVQLGTSLDRPIENAINLLGKTTLREAGAVIKYALCNISIEGGIVWLAKAVGTKSIVLFGPTDIGFFGQPENINLTASLPCSPCWWKITDWNYVCPTSYESPKCMDEITPDIVFREVQNIIRDKNREKSFGFVLKDIRLFSNDLVTSNRALLNELYKEANLPFDQVNKNIQNDTTGIYIHGSKHWEYSYGLKHLLNLSELRRNSIRILDVGSGRGGIHKLLLQRGYDVTIADINFAHLGNQWESKFLAQCPPSLGIAFNSIFNLSFPSEFFDVVFCFSVIEHVQQKFFAIKEMLRVLKGNGLLILTFDLTSQQAWENDIDDIFGKKYRVEVFNEKTLVYLLRSLGVRGDYSEEWLLKQYSSSADDIQKSSVEGIPPGLTVGGLVISKCLNTGID